METFGNRCAAELMTQQLKALKPLLLHSVQRTAEIVRGTEGRRQEAQNRVRLRIPQVRAADD